MVVSGEATDQVREEHEQLHASHLHTPNTGQIAVVAQPIGHKAIDYPTTCINNTWKRGLGKIVKTSPLVMPR